MKAPKGVVPMDASIADYAANELQTSGRVTPIVWGINDPIYRDAVEAGKIKSGEEMPAISDALATAGKLGAEYVLAVDIRSGQNEILGMAFLYRGGKLIWKDPVIDIPAQMNRLKLELKKKLISQQEYDQGVLNAGCRSNAVQLSAKFGAEATLHAMARTWVEMIMSGPLQSLPKQPEKFTPAPGKGQGPVDPGVGTAPPAKADDNHWLTDLAAALKAGDANLAVSILRDAVDASPMDFARRISLAKTLIQFGQPEVAAREARRAAELMPEHLEFRSLAARAWIQAGNSDEAQTDLNEAVTRAPDSPETRLLLANVALSKGDFATAIDHLSKAISVGPTGDAYYLRALAHAMAGDSRLADADVKKATEVGLSQDPQEADSRYGLVAAIFDDGLSAIGGEIRTLHQRAQVQRTDKDVATTRDDLVKRVNGRSKFIAELPVPAGYELSHNRRILAYKLLSQCLIDLSSFMKSGDEDVLTDSRISLGEALKQGASARQRFKDEQQGAKKSDGKPG
jgi:tetratricopeptide (TPR) repeat protein